MASEIPNEVMDIAKVGPMGKKYRGNETGLKKESHKGAKK